MGQDISGEVRHASRRKTPRSFSKRSRAQQTPVLRTYDKKKPERLHATAKIGKTEGADGAVPEKPGFCPWLPTFSQLRGFLTAVEGIAVPELEALEAAIVKLRGTPQEPVSWENPETWIEERLQANDQAVARRIWARSKHKTNPRYLRGPGIVAERYDLTEQDDDQKWQITAPGKDLLASEFGATERGIDLQEGMAELLGFIQVKPNSRRGDLLPVWRDFVVTHSNVRQESVVKHFLYNRLQSLLDRKLIERNGQRYKLTRQGEDYLGSLTSGVLDSGLSRTQELIGAVEVFNRSQREMLRERLETMDPYAFERLIYDLLYRDGLRGRRGDAAVERQGRGRQGCRTVRDHHDQRGHPGEATPGQHPARCWTCSGGLCTDSRLRKGRSSPPGIMERAPRTPPSRWVRPPSR